MMHKIVKSVPWAAFDRLVADHDADRRVRQLSTKCQSVALLHAQI